MSCVARWGGGSGTSCLDPNLSPWASSHLCAHCVSLSQIQLYMLPRLSNENPPGKTGRGLGDPNRHQVSLGTQVLFLSYPSLEVGQDINQEK